MAQVSTKRMILPVVDETYEDHFTTNSWASPQDQVDAGYPIFIQPTNPTAKFVCTHDVGTLITDSVLITVSCPLEQPVPTVDIECQIEVSTDNATWTTFTNTFQCFVGNFRYVRVTLDFDADDNHELAIAGPVRLRITIKHKKDAGNGTSDASLPAAVVFNVAFIDVRSITVTAAYNASYPVIAVYDFTDVPNPTGFDVYCFRSDTGAQVANDFSWKVEGV